VAARLTEAATTAYPRECCGLLLGRGSHVAGAWPAGNLSDHPHRYLIDPRDHFAALRAARAQGLDVVGAYHSHPDAPPRPSATDLAEALEAFLYIIVSVGQDGAAGIGAWRLVAGNFAEVRLVIESEESLP
jgi:proteasome lid subunit RPN8/RPN11